MNKSETITISVLKKDIEQLEQAIKERIETLIKQYHSGEISEIELAETILSLYQLKSYKFVRMNEDE